MSMGIQKLSNMRNLTKIAISQATFGVRRPMSTTFVDIFKGYNAEVYTKVKFALGNRSKLQNSATLKFISSKVLNDMTISAR